MKIGLDFDGVIADSTATKLMLAQKLYGAIVTPAQWRRDIILSKQLLAAEAYDHIQELVYGTDEYGFEMTPVVSALVGIEKLLDARHNLTIVTSRIDKKAEIAQEWCRTHGINLPLIGAGRGKSKAPYLTGFNIFVDDSVEKLLHIVDTVPNLFLFNEPYNQDVETPTPIKRATNWDNLLYLIGNITTP